MSEVWTNRREWNICTYNVSPIAMFMEPTWGPSGANRTQVGPILAPWTLLSGIIIVRDHVYMQTWYLDDRLISDNVIKSIKRQLCASNWQGPNHYIPDVTINTLKMVVILRKKLSNALSVPNNPDGDKPVLVPVIVRRRVGDKPLSELKWWPSITAYKRHQAWIW